jgi:DNA primase
MKRRGNRLTGRSPFREDKNPSFSADFSRNLWNDFGGRPVIDGREVSGDVFGLVQAIRGCSFRDALVELDRDFMYPAAENVVQTARDRIETAVGDGTPAPSDNREVRPTDGNTCPPVAPAENIPFGRELKGRTNIPPLLERGLTEETIKRWGVVYCTAGMMKGRIAFPIRNVSGEIMAYAGRAVKKEDEEKNGKYRFPPNFNKSTELFGIDRIANVAEAKKAAKDYGLILVEGFTDAMKLEQEGFPNVVALMGTDFHEAQKALLLDPKLNPTRRVTLFLDNDEAGNIGKRKIARALIHDAFIRYVDWSKIAEIAGDEHVRPPKTEPEHFNRIEIKNLLVF